MGWCLFASVLTAPQLTANPFESYGAGWMAGTSGAGTAVVSDWTAAYYNPAGMSHPAWSEHNLLGFRRFSAAKTSTDKVGENSLLIRNKKKENSDGFDAFAGGPANPMPPQPPGYPAMMGLGYIQVLPAMQIRLNGGSSTSRSQANSAQDLPAYGFIQTGLNYDLRRIFDMPWDIPVVIGTVLMISADGTVSNAPDLNEKTYNFRRTGDNSQIIGASFGLSIQPWKDRLSIGFSPGNQLYIDGNVEVRNITLDNNNPTKIDAVADAKAQPAPIAGILYRQPLPMGRLFISTVFRSKVSIASQLKVKTELPLGIEQEQTVLARNDLSPHTFVLGFGWQDRGYRVFADLEYQAWSGVTLNPARAQNESPLNFRDIIVVRTGAEVALNQTSLLRKVGVTTRAGFAYIPTMTPEQTGNANYLDNNKVISSIGFRRTFPALGIAYHPVELDLGFSWQHWLPRTSLKTGAGPLPDGSAQPDYSYGGDVFLIAVSLNWRI